MTTEVAIVSILCLPLLRLILKDCITVALLDMVDLIPGTEVVGQVVSAEQVLSLV